MTSDSLASETKPKINTDLDRSTLMINAKKVLQKMNETMNTLNIIVLNDLTLCL